MLNQETVSLNRNNKARNVKYDELETTDKILYLKALSDIAIDELDKYKDGLIETQKKHSSTSDNKKPSLKTLCFLGLAAILVQSVISFLLFRIII